MNQIVIRPSGVWNSRSPLNNYVEIVREIHRTHSLTSLSSQHLFDHLDEASNQQETVKVFFERTARDTQRRGKYVNMFNRSYGAERGTQPEEKTLETLQSERGLIETGALRLATVMINGAIESYVQCWFLNYCLAKLEAKTALSDEELRLVDQFNPAKSKRPRPPKLGKLMNDHSVLKSLLEKIPPYRTHPKTRKRVEQAEAPEKSAFKEIQYWQKFRNLIVHSNGLCSPQFVSEFLDYHNYKRDLSRRIPRLVEFEPLPLNENIFSTQAACFYSVAFSLRDELLRVSKIRRNEEDWYLRGHRSAPGPRTVLDGDAASPPMLIEGDHEDSLMWTRDARFREWLAKEQGWKHLRR